MDRTAVFVDAGYLFAAGSILIAGEKLTRGDVQLDYDATVALFARLCTELSGLPLLRIYWYDGTSTGPTPQQLALGYSPSVKVRLGFVNQQGQQKGVDSLIVTDLINLARNRAIADAILLTGDEDIRVGVQQAQELGVRVHLVGIAPARDNQSGFLVQEADSLRELSRIEVQSFMSKTVRSERQPPVGSLPSSGATVNGTIDDIAKRIASALSAEEIDAVLLDSRGGSVPAEIDRRLLLAATEGTGAPMASADKRRLRAAFLEECRKKRG